MVRWPAAPAEAGPASLVGVASECLGERARLRVHGVTVAPRFGCIIVRQPPERAAQAAVDRPLRRPLGGRNDGRTARSLEDLARGNGRVAAGAQVSKGDLLVERGAGRLQQLADRMATRGDGVGEWLSEELRADAAFLRKLKPSLIAARARGQAPTDQRPEAPPPAPAPQRAAQPKRGRKGGGPLPLLVVGAAFVAGVALAKVIDWRGHAHPRD
jgi:hypothetical protein